MTNINSFELSGNLKRIVVKKDRHGQKYFVLILENINEIDRTKFKISFSILIFDESLIGRIQEREFLGLPIFVAGHLVNKRNKDGVKALSLVGKRILKR